MILIIIDYNNQEISLKRLNTFEIFLSIKIFNYHNLIRALIKLKTNARLERILITIISNYRYKNSIISNYFKHKSQ